MSNNQNTKQQQALQAAEAERDALRNQVAELQARNEELASMPEGVSMQSAGSFQPAGPAKYKFEVTGRGMRKGVHVSESAQVIAAPDESEAIRIYCLSEERDGRRVPRNQVLDPSNFRFTANCLTKERQKGIREQYDNAGTPAELIPQGAR